MHGLRTASANFVAAAATGQVEMANRNVDCHPGPGLAALA